ncbi:hypothetical protein [Sulfurimonas sp.]
MNKTFKLYLGVTLSLALANTLIAQENITGTPSKKKTKQKHTLSSSFSIGIGYDDNPYMTPSNSYIEPDRNVTLPGTLITQKQYSGIFTPIDAKINYEYRLKQRTRLLADFKASGKFFYDASLDNANEYKVYIDSGVRFRINKYKREKHNIDLKVFANNVYRIYVDYDNGTAKTTAGGDQSNRYQYTSFGAIALYDYKYKKLDYLASLSYEIRDYATPDTWSSLDHNYLIAKVQAGYKISKKTHIGAYYRFRVRDYTERKVYQINPDGTITLTNVGGVTYTYNDIKLSLKHKFNKKLKSTLYYMFTLRSDDHQGYSDYYYHRVTLDTSYKFTKRFTSFLGLNYHIYDYLNAYAFDRNTAQDKKYADGYKVDFKNSYKLNKKWQAIVDVSYKDESNTDKRYDYSETMIVAQVKYSFKN